MDTLAAGGVLFEQTVSQAPWTLPAMGAIMSGQHAHKAFDSTPPKLQRSAVESIREGGISTAAFTEGGFFSKFFGFDLGFEHHVEEEGPVGIGAGGAPKARRKTGSIESTFSLAKDWLRSHRESRFFVLIHTYEAHIPYTRTTFAEKLDSGVLPRTFTYELSQRLQAGEFVLGETEKRYLQALYDGGIAECDRQVGLFIEFLGEIGLRDKTLLVVTSDHGEEMGDRYPANAGSHGHSLHDELLLVPLIIFDPTQSYEADRVRVQVRSIDILPTILDLLRVPPVTPMDGESLVPLMGGLQETGRLARGGNTSVGPARNYIRHLGYKMIRVMGPAPAGAKPLDPAPLPIELFDLKTDSAERNNVAEDRPELVKRMLQLFDPHREKSGQESTLELENLHPEIEKRLKSLGYLE